MPLYRVATVVLVLAGTSVASAQDREVELCTCVRELNAAIAALHSLEPSATGDQVHSATERAEQAAAKLETSLERNRPKQYAAFDKARTRLESAVEAIPADATEEQARASIADEEMAVSSALDAMLGSVQCP